MVGTDAAKASRTASARVTSAALTACRAHLWDIAADWAEVECRRKGTDPGSALAFEEWTHGPLAAARSLTLWERSLAARERGEPSAPQSTTIDALPALPFDSLLFRDYRVRTSYLVDSTAPPARPDPLGRGLVLAAGNVSALAVTDCLQLLCTHAQHVTVKLPPTLTALAPILREVFAPIGAGAVEIVVGDHVLAEALLREETFTAIHLTGAAGTLTAVERGVGGRPRPPHITAELGNVTPLIVIPLRYRPRELQVMIDEAAAMLTHHGGFNCVTPRVIVTAASWPQRVEFLARLRNALAATTPRLPWYPGAVDSLLQHTRETVDPDRPLHTRLLDAHRNEPPAAFVEECFAPIAWQIALEADDLATFLHTAVDFCNLELFGTLAAQVFTPMHMTSPDRVLVNQASARLEYGTLATNCWAALGYAFAASPWGAARSSRGTAFGSGRGYTNLRRDGHEVVRTTIDAPLRAWPVPIWRSAARAPTRAARALLALTLDPRWRNLPPALAHLLGWTTRERRAALPGRSTTTKVPGSDTTAGAE